MRLVSYASAEGGGGWRAGVVRGADVVDAAEAGEGLGGAGDNLSSVRGVLGLGDRLPDLAGAVAGADAVGAAASLLLGPPIPDPDKILCIGLNYAAHAEETKLDSSAVPTVFAKFRNSLVGSGAPIVVPEAAVGELDFEGELAVVIGRRCRRVAEVDALAAVAGVMPLNDVSARNLQLQTPQWTAGKAIDTFAPCGPELVLLDEVEDVQNLQLTTRVNGTVVQDASTERMIFGVAHIVAFLSSFMTLEPGDVIATGTPAGVGFTREPPLYLHEGDEVEVEIDGVGLLRNVVEHESPVLHDPPRRRGRPGGDGRRDERQSDRSWIRRPWVRPRRRPRRPARRARRHGGGLRPRAGPGR
jgi:2-keto-4-pentenoate hydratase/2-oxohepta-3-ene-1,7-dioic acid hydratase in catechol pathway